jgi:hypothetical protein
MLKRLSHRSSATIIQSLAWGLLALVLSLAIVIEPTSAAVRTTGTLATNSGPSILDNQLLKMLDDFIPTSKAHSTLIILTQCYGGDMLDDFEGRDNTTVLSATSPGEKARYGGYDDDAAKSLKPEEGNTSDKVHEAGEKGKAAGETPQKQGPAEGASLEPTDSDGSIKSRHVLVYAGKPHSSSNEPYDKWQRDTIKANFATGGTGTTTVTTVGGEGKDGWDYPGTLQGLRDALKDIGNEMSPDEQFVLFVTDHGDIDKIDDAPACEGWLCTSAPLTFGTRIYDDMLADPNNQPAVSLFSFDPIQPSGPVTVTVGTASFFNVVFEIQLDLNGDGDLDDEGEGWQARVPLDEAQIDPNGETIIIAGTETLTLDLISLESGEIAKVSPSVGGTMKILVDSTNNSGPSPLLYATLSGVIAAAAIAIVIGTRHTRRRRLQ